MNNWADLHLHSTFSDGTLTPSELVLKGIEVGAKAIAITDHDCIDGIREAQTAGNTHGLEIIAGVELSTIWKSKEIHILGYDFDLDSTVLQIALQSFVDDRKNRVDLILHKLSLCNIQINIGDVLAIAGDGAVGRPHIAKAMLSKGYVHTINQAFQSYLNPRGAAYVPRNYISPQEAIDLIQVAQGLPVLAHPGLYQRDDLIPFLADQLVGMEVWHCDHGKKAIQHYLALANKYDLIPTGGSDWHGHLKQTKCGLGNVQLDYDYLLDLLASH